MRIIFNKKEYSTDSDHITVKELLNLNQLPTIGLAVAVNNKVIRKNFWDSTNLSEGDQVTVITAVCGG